MSLGDFLRTQNFLPPLAHADLGRVLEYRGEVPSQEVMDKIRDAKTKAARAELAQAKAYTVAELAEKLLVGGTAVTPEQAFKAAEEMVKLARAYHKKQMELFTVEIQDGEGS